MSGLLPYSVLAHRAAVLKNARKRSSSPTENASRSQSFTCSADLLRAFEQRASDLGCSFDWLLEEAMQRLLAEETTARKMERPSAPPESLERKIHTPLPLPPDSMPKTLPPPPARVERSAPVVAVEPEPELAPLVLDADGERFVIDRLPFVVGRSPSACQLVIDDGLVSRRHAAFEHGPEGWAITDLGSTNGIITDGETVRHASLRPGVVMSIGPMTFVVVSS